MKPHSYFALLNYYTLILCLSIMKELELLFHSIDKHLILHMSMQITLNVIISIFFLLTVMATCFYAFSGSYQTSYHKFYSYYQIVFTMVLLVHYTASLFILFWNFEPEPLYISFLSWKIMNVTFLSLLMGVSFRFKDVVYGDYSGDDGLIEEIEGEGKNKGEEIKTEINVVDEEK